jgi:8-oxo-dGTP pyrophosphatase MutT (NUDIX family)
MPTHQRAAAYVLPLVEHQGQLYVLLGKEAYDGVWSGFGGGLEGKEKATVAAAREAWEESFGLLGRPHEIMKRMEYLGQPKNSRRSYFALFMEPHQFHTLPQYFADFRYFMTHCPKTNLDKQHSTHHCVEKTQAAWFPWKDIIGRHKIKHHPKGGKYISRTFLSDLHDIVLHNN